MESSLQAPVMMWGIYPWLPELGIERIHPNSRSRILEDSPYGRVFKLLDTDDGDWVQIEGATGKLKVTPDLFLTVPRPKFIFGQDVRWEEIVVRGLAGINNDAGEDYSIAGSPYTIEEWGLPKGLVLLEYLGSKWIALDYSESLDPKVVLVEPDKGRKVLLGDDFSQFLGRLVAVTFD